jgi:hypothetical protein
MKTRTGRERGRALTGQKIFKFKPLVSDIPGNGGFGRFCCIRENSISQPCGGEITVGLLVK